MLDGKVKNTMENVSEKITESLGWLKEQFKRPSYCVNRKMIKEDDAQAICDTENVKEVKEVKKECDDLDNLPCCEDPETNVSKVQEPQSVQPFEDDYYCTIKMQNPYEDYEEEEEEKIIFPPCPPKTYSQVPRDPTCTCDLCMKNNIDRKCCKQRKSEAINYNKKIGRLEDA